MRDPYSRPVADDPTPAVDPAGADAHVLRLSLDLQLDALLAVLSAVAADFAANEEWPSACGAGVFPPAPTALAAPAAPAGTVESIPWRRWLHEDVQRACALAGVVLSARVSLPGILGRDPAHTTPAVVTGDLLARFESLAEYLFIVSGGDGRPRWRAGVRSLAMQCEWRAHELRTLSAAHGPPRQTGPPPPAAPGPSSTRTPLVLRGQAGQMGENVVKVANHE